MMTNDETRLSSKELVLLCAVELSADIPRALAIAAKLTRWCERQRDFALACRALRWAARTTQRRQVSAVLAAAAGINSFLAPSIAPRRRGAKVKKARK